MKVRYREIAFIRLYNILINIINYIFRNSLAWAGGRCGKGINQECELSLYKDWGILQKIVFIIDLLPTDMYFAFKL